MALQGNAQGSHMNADNVSISEVKNNHVTRAAYNSFPSFVFGGLQTV